MAYDYIKKAYGFDAKIGDRVQHTVTKKYGSIARQRGSNGHYIQVRFDGGSFALPCHPGELVHI
ncbi:MAG TPA: hypothetical protein VGH23_15470 [Rhizomicrobium sp.]|jgi:hypothetical protein